MDTQAKSHSTTDWDGLGTWLSWIFWKVAFLGHFLGMPLADIDSVTADAGGQVGEILRSAWRTNQGGSRAASS